MYNFLSQGANIPHFRVLWEAKLPLKIKIFSWQLALDKLPSGMQLVTRFGPSDGRCSLCGNWENASHIFFECSKAKFASSVVRQALGMAWSPQNFSQLLPILANLLSRSGRLVWALFLAQP